MFLIDEDTTVKGHSDFYGADRYDFTKEDHGWTSPFNPFSTGRHFETLQQAEKAIGDAMETGNLDDFERAMHDMQDFYSHRKKGYEYDPITGKWGHSKDGTKPDRDMNAWNLANEKTIAWINEWEKKWGRPKNPEGCSKKCK